MIRVLDRKLSATAAKALQRYQHAVLSEPSFQAQLLRASEDFGNYNRKDHSVFSEVRAVLDTMCSGARRCMYCDDSCADEVEHFRPKNIYPDFVFIWENYLYSCGPCNGSWKRSRFAVFKGKAVVHLKVAEVPRKGSSVLINPREEDPLDLLMLDIAGNTFRFVPTESSPSREFDRADYTIRLLGLNERDYLPRARREAYGSYKARLVEYAKRRDSGQVTTR